MASLRSLACFAAALAPTVQAFPIGEFFKLVPRDPPAALPERATALDKMWQPAFDFDTDGCYNTPAIDANGNVNPGLDHVNTGLSSQCHDLSDLTNNNVYSRARCNNGWCAIVYDYFFEKDVAIANFPIDTGHRNDWEHVIVWVQNGQAKYVSASAHGDYDTRAASAIRWDGNHPKIVYHKDGLSTHAMRFANADDDAIENATGAWFFGSLVSWNGFPSTAVRDKLSSYDFGSASFALKDSGFQGNLDTGRKDFITGFNTGVDDGSPGNP